MPIASVKTKNTRGSQLRGPLCGDLAAFYEVGLHQRGVAERSRYRYKGALLRYQEYLRGGMPSSEASVRFLVHLKKSGFAPSSLKVYRSALSLFHQWRGEKLEFKVKVPRRKPPYIESSRVEDLLQKASQNHRHWLALALMAFAGLRISEVASLQNRDVNLANNSLRFFAKGGKERIIPIPARIYGVLAEVVQGDPDETLVGLTASGIYKMVKRLAPDMHPHDLRHACLTRLVERGADIRAVQELAGHEELSTTSQYLGLSPTRLEETVALLDEHTPRAEAEPRDRRPLEVIDSELRTVRIAVDPQYEYILRCQGDQVYIGSHRVGKGEYLATEHGSKRQSK